MAEEKKSWNQVAKEEFDAIQMPINNAESIRHLVNCIWATTHDDTIESSEMASNLALLSGMATAALLEYARELETRAAKGE